jgi:transcriptional regulator with XRE-family HTH domain
MMNSQQCKIARAALGWSAAELAARAQVGTATVNRFETAHTDPPGTQSKPIPTTVAAMQRVLEAEGVIFDARGDGIKTRRTNLIAAGEKFALIAIETRSAVELPPTELTPGLWVSSTPMIGLEQFWKEQLGSIRMRDFLSCTLFLLTKQTTDSAVEQALKDRVWRFYTGMLLADRYGTEQVPFLITGDRNCAGINIRQVTNLEPAIHASANRWHRLSTEQVKRGTQIGQAIQNFPWIGAPRLNHVLSLYLEARTRLDWMDRIHQYTRCLDGLTIPPISGTGKKFADRMTLIVGPMHRDLFEEIYAIRGAIEHLREKDYTEPFDRAGRLGLVKKAGIVEYVVRSSLVHILETKLLWEHFKTKPSLLAFWDLAAADRQRLWGAAIDPMSGIAGFDEADWSDEDLGSQAMTRPIFLPLGSLDSRQRPVAWIIRGKLATGDSV